MIWIIAVLVIIYLLIGVVFILIGDAEYQGSEKPTTGEILYLLLLWPLYLLGAFIK